MKNFIKIFISIILFVLSFFIDISYIKYALLFMSYIIVGYEVLYRAFMNIIHFELLDENFLMMVSTIGAIAIGEYSEAVCVMLFYSIGEAFQDYAVDRSKKHITDLMDIKSEYANLYNDGNSVRVEPESLNIGDIIIVKPGEKIPVDGTIIDGNSKLNMSALTGESIPVSVKVNDEVLSGSINNNGLLKIKVLKEYKDSTVSRIIDLIENSDNNKSDSEKFITKFCKYYTPIVVLFALIIAFLLPVVSNLSISTCIYRALSFLVVSCPCALVISIPLSFFSGIGACSLNGVLVKGSNYLECLSKCSTIICDKTGTLTEGVFKVNEIKSFGITNDELLHYAALCEHGSNHPIAVSIKNEYNKELDINRIKSLEEICGQGIKCIIDNDEVLFGNELLLSDCTFDKVNKNGTIVYMSINNKYVGYILISDKIKDESYDFVKNIKNLGINRIIMLSGDNNSIVKDVSEKLNINEYYGELLPQQKVNKVKEIIKESSDYVSFVGDGINDAPVLSLSDIGISMGGVGSEAAIEASSIVLMNDELNKICISINIARKVMNIVKQNIIFAIGVKIIILVLSAFGITSMWESVFGDVGVTILATLNALRILFVKRK